MSANGGAIGISAVSQEVTESMIDSIKKDTKVSSNDASINEEKGDLIDVDEREHDNYMLSHEEQFPEDPNGEIETQQFTFRAVLVGCILGGVIAASKSALPPFEDPRANK
jgi:hypothetical protein